MKKNNLENIKTAAARDEIKRDGDYLLSDLEVRAQLGGICRSTLYKMIKAEKICPPIKIGFKSFWRAEVILAWLEAQQPMQQKQQ